MGSPTGARTRVGLVAAIAAIVALATAVLTFAGPPAPSAARIDSIAPSATARGELVTITGIGFGARNVHISVAGVPAVVQAATGNSATFRVPHGAPPGPTIVVATNPGGRSGSIPFTVLNRLPRANAGPDQTALLTAVVHLDGSGSTDADGDSLSFRWSFVSRPNGSAASLSDPSVVRPTFVLDVRGRYTVQLIVRDGFADSAPDIVQIDTQNSPPVADAGPDQTVPVGATVQLDGTASSDIDGDLLTFQWSFVARPAGSQASLTDEAAPGPAFVADLPGRYVVQLVVSDGVAVSRPATVTIDTRNSQPVANAGAEQTATLGATVQLDGSGSSDVDQDPLTFRWSFVSRPAGSAAVLSDTAAVNPTFVADAIGLFVVQLIVNDGALDSAPATSAITVGVAGAVNQPPLVSAGAEQTVTLPSAAALNGRVTDDGLPVGGSLTVRWSTLSGPATATFANPNAPQTTATFSEPGTYFLRMTANDGELSSTGDVRVTVNAAPTANQPPVVSAGNDQVISLPASASLSGSVTDDGLPAPPSLTIAWTTVSGPGTVTFGEATSALTTASFSAAGTYVLRLTADDGELTANAQTTVTVNPPLAAGFTFTLDSTTASPFAGSTALILFRIERAGGFSAPITVRLLNSPPGISAESVEMPDNISDAALRLEIAAAVPAGAVAVELVAEGGGVIRSAVLNVTIRPPEPTSLERIAAATLDGTLDTATSLLYRAYALVGDPRLPDIYQGSGSDAEDIGLILEIAEILPTVSADMRALLEPFTLRPAATNSWYNQLVASLAGGTSAVSQPALRALAVAPPLLPDSCDSVPANTWISRRSAEHPVRVWAPCADDDPDIAVDMIERVLKVLDKVWVPMTTGPMGAPKPDRAANEAIDAADGVGDEAIDVYLVMPSSVVKRLEKNYTNVARALGWATPWRPDVTDRQRSGFLSLLWTTVMHPLFHSTVMHELFHVLQFAHNTNMMYPYSASGVRDAAGQRWWYVEASANWAEAHFDRTLAPWDAGRQAVRSVYAPWFVGVQGKEGEPGIGFQLTRHSLVSLNDSTGKRPYEAFIWPYFMEHIGDADVPPGVWTVAATANTPAGADRAMDFVLPFKENFREFAVRNLNKAFEPGDALPQEKRYVGLDPVFPDGKEPSFTDEFVLGAGAIRSVPIRVAPLAAYYARFKVEDSRIQKVIFDLDALTSDIRAAVDLDALVKIEGKGWKRQDWNGKNEVVFCFDNADEKLEALTLVVSNHRVQPAYPASASADTSIKVTASAAPCDVAWVGTSVFDWQLKFFPNTHIRSKSNVRWTVDADSLLRLVGIDTFTPSGSMTVELYEANGCVATVIPNTVLIDATDGQLTIDYNVVPNVADGHGAVGLPPDAKLIDCQGREGVPEGAVGFFMTAGPLLLNDKGDELIKRIIIADDLINFITLDLDYRRVRR